MNKERKGKEGRSEWIRKIGMCGDEVCGDGNGMKGEWNKEEEGKCEGIGGSDNRRSRDNNKEDMKRLRRRIRRMRWKKRGIGRNMSKQEWDEKRGERGEIDESIE